ncbi:hypothetical protein CYOC110262_27560 [Cytobacillus oceanisediminis]|uniref:Uncharacterized protein n=1 Tax=Cytobacillus oceanisediminis TaxID=665099 RepID=A0A562J4B1_9BACI|nr:hypothetical protein IQ19_05506 [Cytobacillus oceanisediminis]
MPLDTDNFLIRKQRWYIRHPEKFSPAIDIEWQQKQLKEEKAKETQLKGGLECGPEGCEIQGLSRLTEMCFYKMPFKYSKTSREINPAGFVFS